MATMMTRVPLRLALLGFLSVAWTLNPDDPNVCSHWERSVTPPLETSRDWSDDSQTLICRPNVWKKQNKNKLYWCLLQMSFTSEQRGGTVWQISRELRNFFHRSPDSLILSRLNGRNLFRWELNEPSARPELYKKTVCLLGTNNPGNFHLYSPCLCFCFSTH